MKRIFSLLCITCALALQSCNVRDEYPVSDTIPVLFGYNVWESGDIVKSDNSQAIRQMIHDRMPEVIPIKLTNVESGKVYELETGKQYYMPSGSYKVSGGTHQSVTYHRGLDPCITLKETTITISRNESRYSLEAYFDCYALVFDTANCSTVSVGTSSWTTNLYTSSQPSGLLLYFFKQEITKITMMPVSEEFESLKYNSESCPFEYGRYYFFSISNSPYIEFEADCPEMTEGSI